MNAIKQNTDNRYTSIAGFYIESTTYLLSLLLYLYSLTAYRF